EKDLMSKIKRMAPDYVASAEQVAMLGAQNKDDQATALLRQQFDPRGAALQPVVRQLVEFEDKENEDAAVGAEQTYTSARTLMVLLGAIAAMLAVAAALVVTRSILKQLGGEPSYAAEVLHSIAAGDLTVEVQTRQGDES